MTEGKKMNPDIKLFEFGVKELRTIRVYPLSLYDQEQLTEDVTSLITSITEKLGGEEMKDEQSLIFIRDLIKENLQKILEYITVEDERPTLKELTNNQFYTLIDIIFSVNYEGLIKNFKGLFRKAAGLVAQEGASKV